LNSELVEFVVLMNERFVGFVCSVVNIEIAVAIEIGSNSIRSITSGNIVCDVAADVKRVNVVPCKTLEVLAVNIVNPFVVLNSVVPDEFVFLQGHCTGFTFIVFEQFSAVENDVSHIVDNAVIDNVPVVLGSVVIDELIGVSHNPVVPPFWE
jgi:hypothetical protein